MLALRLFVSSLSRHPVAWRSASRQFSMAPGMVRREKTTQRLSWSKCSAQHVKLRQLSTEAEDLDKDEESNNGLELSDSCVEVRTLPFYRVLNFQTPVPIFSEFCRWQVVRVTCSGLLSRVGGAQGSSTNLS